MRNFAISTVECHSIRILELLEPPVRQTVGPLGRRQTGSGTKPGTLRDEVEWREETARKQLGVEQDPGTTTTTSVTRCQPVITTRCVPLWQPDRTHRGYNPTEGNHTRLRSKSYTYPENWQFPLRPRQAREPQITPVDRLSVCCRYEDFEPVLQSATYTLGSTQPSATIQEDLVVVGGNKPSRSGLDAIINPASYRSSGVSSQPPCNRHGTALRLSYPLDSGSPHFCPH